MKTAEQFVQEALAWLEHHYWDQPFFLERDIVWTLQCQLLTNLERESAPYRVHNDYPVLPGKRTDIALLDERDSVELAMEVKYEPSHLRADILSSKLPVVFWDSAGVANDILRIHDYVKAGTAKVAVAVLIDEGGHFAKRQPHPGSEWRKWAHSGFILYARAWKQ